MGFIRGGTVFILTTVLFLSLFIGNIFLTLNWSLQYENAEPHLENLTKDMIQTANIDTLLIDQFEIMQTICLSYDSFDFLYKEEIIKIPCETIQLGSEAIINYGAEKIPEMIYYKQYDCEFIDCIKEDPLVLVSEKSKEYWKSKFYLAIIVSIILFTLLFFISKDKHTPFLISGIILVVTALPFKKINVITDLFKDLLPFDILTIFFSKAQNVFAVMAIIGIVFVILGFAIGFLKWGTKINEFLNKIIKKKNKKEKEENKLTEEQIKSIVKKEIKKKV